MPCYTVQTNSVDVPTLNPTLRGRALVSMGVAGATPQLLNFQHGGHWYRFGRGELTSTTATVEQLQEVAALVKRHYAAEVVKYTAKRNGWQLKQTGQFAYEVIK